MTKQILVGGVPVGGGAPVSIQSMCSTKTDDVPATVNQIHRLEAAGCEIVRVAVPDMAAARAISTSRWWRIFTLITSWPWSAPPKGQIKSASTPAISAERTG